MTAHTQQAAPTKKHTVAYHQKAYIQRLQTERNELLAALKTIALMDAGKILNFDAQRAAVAAIARAEGKGP